MRVMPTVMPDRTKIPTVSAERFAEALEPRMGRPLTPAEVETSDRMAAHNWCLSPIVDALKDIELSRDVCDNLGPRPVTKMELIENHWKNDC